ncbi:MAG: DNA methyltransferase [Patescibacteria group bacterium]|nr:DNA methyltransferase [Patescibacteria group bacterium]
MNSQKLETVYVDIDTLKENEFNKRLWPDKNIRDLEKSIKDHGVISPLLVNSAPGRENILLSGHFRVHVLKKLGYKQVPVNFISVPDIEKEKRILLTLNKVEGEWDYEGLKEFDIGTLLDIGFDDSDLSAIWSDVLSVEDDDFDIDKQLDEIKIPKSKLGDLYELGTHRIICGDSTDPAVVKQLLGKDEVNVLSCDPIYNISYSYSGKNNKYGAEVEDNRSDDEYRELLKKSIQNGLSVSSEDLHCFYFCDQRYIGLLQSLYAELGVDSKRVALWIKNNQSPTPQIAFSKCYEPCVYGIKGSPYLSPINNLNEILNKEIGTGNRTIDDILDLLDIWLVKRMPTSEYEHATSKPPTLYEKMLRRCSKPNDAVLDLFMGSASQMIACEQLKRKFYGVELEPIYVDLAIRRWEALTGQKAKLISEGGQNESK